MAERRGKSAIGFYHQAAGTIAPRYDSVSFAAVHPGLGARLPPPPAAGLDVGAGSGRDARALSALGYHVTAAEPAEALRELGQRSSPGVEWLDDRLPDLPRLHARKRRFDFILCSAVLMSLPEAELGPALLSMAELLVPGGLLSISVRDPRKDERLLHGHSDPALRRAGEAAGLAVTQSAEAADALGRGLLWRSYLLAKAGDRPAGRTLSSAGADSEAAPGR